MKLVVGLGNPGKEYSETRHNAGYMALDYYLKEVNWKNDKFADVYKSKDTIFIKPTTFMNLSGNAVSYYLYYYKIDIKDLLVIQDDMDLETGTIRLKINSSSGGHNGIKDIIHKIGSDNFLRLKIGISKPEHDTIDYVLSHFKKEELETLEKTFIITNKIIEDFINGEEADKLMNKYN